MSEKTDIKSMDLEELKTFFSDMGLSFQQTKVCP